ncbi:MAG: isopenicillin N synthase family oxygenase [Acidimicrobiia bacterium]|nr:isopenicillin N synthase family oxygenase [Acidimicrobiia bacterium]
MPALPLIDVSPERDLASVAAEIDDACRRLGFFRISGHSVSSGLMAELDRLARAFFDQPDDVKAAIAMPLGGPAWRGWFPLDGELTAGVPDHKEGIYFGTELPPEHPAVRAGRPLHGANQFPAEPTELRAVVLAWIEAMTGLGTHLLRAVAVGLGAPADWFEREVTAEPTVLARIFRYPPDLHPDGWGVAEHTDYGLLTILAQDGHDGLEVHAPDGWIAVPADPEVLVVNLGDMVERMTGGRYRSTPHRVRNTTTAMRLSFPVFIDPSWDATCPILPLGDDTAGPTEAPARWDGASPLAWEGTYGDYLTAKVVKVFPDLSTGGPEPRC